ncbi:copper homeostasis protein CutC [Atopobacter sp. AH10]|uniref:copper homeostasis protein CutC n=1 Tax=Atopobacter sp. AH10 TaxID=2315861 RepID=UPI000EF1B2E8|nr:copper homeostasis protein CutC [Atopobacter sp. AH10]RLK64199.1 copper homeostasis protein CutC [Atopobacter sp. AH10]
MKLEVCCGSYQDCLKAQAGGADRIELNGALELGGLTPSLSTFRMARAELTIPIIAMVRPRGGGFCYNKRELLEMLHQAEDLLAEGADGLAFGALSRELELNKEFIKELTDLCHQAKAEAVLHRAFDISRNPFAVVESLIQIGVDRILTSGQQSTALEGARLIKALHEQYGKRIEILPAAGIKVSNVMALLNQTRVHQVHSSCSKSVEDGGNHNHGVSFAMNEQNSYKLVSQTEVRQLKNFISIWADNRKD